MSSYLKILAVAAPDAARGYSPLESDFRLRSVMHKNWDKVKASAGGDWEYVSYKTLAEMMKKIKAACKRHAGKKCLRVIEVVAHGNPTKCNGITNRNVGFFAKGIRSLDKPNASYLCDRLNIYLSGCNTGLQLRKKRNKPPPPPSIAENLARHSAIRFKPSFQHEIWVFGSRGYLAGLMCPLSAGSRPKCWPCGPRDRYRAYPESQERSGGSCYKGFNNQ